MGYDEVVRALFHISFCIVLAFLLLYTIADIYNITVLYYNVIFLYWKGQKRWHGAMKGYGVDL